jgi:hypothetical protein
LKVDILKGDILKGDILKGDILKGDILKGDILKDDILKVNILKVDILKDNILKVNILKVNILKDDILTVGNSRYERMWWCRSGHKSGRYRIRVTRLGQFCLLDDCLLMHFLNYKSRLHFYVLYVLGKSYKF